MHLMIDRHRAEIALLCRRFGVTRLELFGSAARGADFDPDASDADFLVEFNRATDLSSLDRYFGFTEALEQVLGRPVDLVEPSAVKNPFLRAAIERSKELIYAA